MTTPPGVPGPVIPLPGRKTAYEIGDITGGPIDPFEWHAASPALKRLFIEGWIAKACQEEGVDPKVWAPAYELLISRESGFTSGIGDPNIVNLYDENAKAGMPSMGLAQVVQPNAPGENLLDPVVNIRASIRHVKEAYGTRLGLDPNTAITRVQQGDPSKPPKGYQTGGPADHRDYPFPRFTNEDDPDGAYAFFSPYAVAGPYQTRLNGQEEKAFRIWLTRNNISLNDFDPNNPRANYDMRGLWKDSGGQPHAGQFFTDRYKTPYDNTFSNESKYATPNNPFYWSDPATLIDKRDGSVVFFAPSHYASASPNPSAVEASPFAPPDMPGYGGGGSASGYGTGWKLGVLHPDGSITPVPLRMMSSGTNETHWDAEVALGPGDQLVHLTAR